MAKRRKQKPRQVLDRLSSEQLRVQIEEQISAGKYRKARDTAKILFKRDAEIGRPLLVKANRLLAEEMLSKGQESEAKTVLDYLQTITSEEEQETLSKISATISGDWNLIGKSALATLSSSGDSLSEKERLRLADEMVISFEPLGESPYAIEARTVQDALQAVTEARWDDARADLRKIPRRSPFAPWTLYIKGLAAFHGDKPHRALELFSQLPLDTAPNRAAAPWRALLEEGSSQDLDPSTIDCWAQMAGMPALANPLREADKLWRDRKIPAAYERLKRTGSAAPDQSELAKQLFELFMSVPFIKAEDEAIPWLSSIEAKIAKRNEISPMEEEEFQRQAIVGAGSQLSDEELRSLPEVYLSYRAKRCGEAPEYEARVHYWTGLILSNPDHHRRLRPPAPRNPSAGAHYLTLAMTKAPAWIEPYQALCNLFEFLGHKKEHQWLVEDMTTRFPSHKETLLTAGNLAMKRRSYRKAYTLFSVAQSADPLDSSVLDLMADAQIGQMIAAFEKHQLQKAHKLFDECSSLSAEVPGGLVRKRWWLLILRSLLEEIWGSAELGSPWLKQALETAPGVGVVWFGRILLHDELTTGNQKVRPLKKKALKLPKDPAPSLANFEDILDLVQRRLKESSKKSNRFQFSASQERWLKSYLRDALQVPFNRSLVAGIFDRLLQNDYLEDLARSMSRQLVKSDHADPLYRLLAFRSKRNLAFWDDDGTDLFALECLRGDAEQLGDHETIKLIEREIRTLQDESPTSPEDLLDDFFDEDMDDDDDIESNFPGASNFASLICILAEASDEAIEEMRRTRPSEIPSSLFESLVNVAREQAQNSRRGPDPRPKPGPTPKPKPSPKPKQQEPADPDQLDLF